MSSAVCEIVHNRVIDKDKEDMSGSRRPRILVG